MPVAYRIFAYLLRNELSTAKAIASDCNCTQQTANKTLLRLMDLGVAMRDKQRGSYHWSLIRGD
ncbi:helix-turn-helix domain-containing protein [Chitiniphilus eburneus]